MDKPLQFKIIILVFSLFVILMLIIFIARQHDIENQIKIYNVTSRLNECETEKSGLSSNSDFLSGHIIYLDTELANCSAELAAAMTSREKLSDYYMRRLDAVTPGFIKLAQEVSASHVYDINEYNCNDFANAYVLRAAEAGLEAKKRYVILPCPAEFNATEKLEHCFGNGQYTGHAIVRVEVYVDPTIGYYIEPRDYALFGLV